MVEIAGRPFLAYLLAFLGSEGIKEVVLASSYKHEVIRNYFGNTFQGLQLRYSVEKVPLGTGGALRQALNFTSAAEALLVNGDTYFAVPINKMVRHHHDIASDITLAVKPMSNVSRYGAVILRRGRVIGFEEKGLRESGYINGGIGLFDRRIIERMPLPERFSLERDLLMTHLKDLRIGGFVSDGYFVDIGVPEDLERARKELPDVASRCA